MKKRNAFIVALFSLMPLGHLSLIGTGAALTSSAVILINSQKVNAESSDYYYNRGTKKHNRGDYYGAIEDYTKAIEINPRDADAFFNRAILKEEILKDYKGALSDYAQTIKINSKYADAYYNRGLLKVEILKDNNGALFDFTQVININSKDADAYWNRSIVKENIGDLRGAVHDQNKALKFYAKKKHF